MAPACASDAEKKALAGLDAFKRCDMREARNAFSEAYSQDSRSDFALAYALSDLAVLAEDPALQPTLKRLGFTADLKTDFLWGQGGVLQRLSEKAPCGTIEESLKKGIPLAALQNGGPNFLDGIDASLTVGDVRVALAGISPRLERIAQALETSAKSTESSFELEGGCGVGKSVIQKPELLAMASLIEALRAGLQALEAYDGALNVKVVLTNGSAEAEKRAYVDALNRQLLRVVKPSAMEASRPIFIRSLDLASRAAQAVSATAATPANALFDWKKLPADVVVDFKTYFDVAKTGLSSKEQTLVPKVSPEIRVNMDSFFAEPFDMGKVAAPIWSVKQYTSSPTTPPTPPQFYIATDTVPLENLLATRFSAGTFDRSRNYTAPAFDALTKITSVTWEAVLDPQKRFQGYTCTSSAVTPAPLPPP